MILILRNDELKNANFETQAINSIYNSFQTIYYSAKSILRLLLLLSPFKIFTRRCNLNRFSVADARYILVKIESCNFCDFAKSARYCYKFSKKIMCIFLSRKKQNNFKMSPYKYNIATKYT